MIGVSLRAICVSPFSNRDYFCTSILIFLWFFFQGEALTDINLDHNDILLGNKDQDMDVSMRNNRSF